MTRRRTCTAPAEHVGGPTGSSAIPTIVPPAYRTPARQRGDADQLGRWRCTGQPQPHDRLLDRIRRLARARTLDQLEDGRRALELAWIGAQVDDLERLVGLEVIGRRHAELVAAEHATWVRPWMREVPRGPWTAGGLPMDSAARQSRAGQRRQRDAGLSRNVQDSS